MRRYSPVPDRNASSQASSAAVAVNPLYRNVVDHAYPIHLHGLLSVFDSALAYSILNLCCHEPALYV